MQNKGFELVGALLGQPVKVDPSRPNAMGRATRVNSNPERPLYRTYKVCRRCQSPFIGLSFAPQYDDDPEQAGTCERCVDALERQEPVWSKARVRPSDLIHSEPARRAADPLEVC